MILLVLIANITLLQFSKVTTAVPVIWTSAPNSLSFVVSNASRVPDDVSQYVSVVIEDGEPEGWWRSSYRLDLNQVIAADSTNSAAGGLGLSPAQLLKQYSADEAPPVADQRSTLATVEISSPWSAQDLKTFLLEYNPKAADTSIRVLGEPNTGGTGASIEGNLDVQMALGLSPRNRPMTVYNFKGNGTRAGNVAALFKWAALVAKDPRPPLIHSISFGRYSAPAQHNVLARFNEELAAMEARGITVLFASGDDATGCNGTYFVSPWPSSPHVTLVGGTVFAPTLTTGDESCWPYSSGGFSADWPRFKAQNTLVTQYLMNERQLPPASFFSTSGRAFPDLSACAFNISMVINGTFTNEGGGTSAAAPITAALLARVNDQLLMEGGAPVTQLNTLVYSHPQLFNDVRVGGQTRWMGCPAGFRATDGFDPCSGVGTMNYAKLSSHLSSRS